jgi:hypothetical protein
MRSARMRVLRAERASGKWHCVLVRRIACELSPVGFGDAQTVELINVGLEASRCDAWGIGMSENGSAPTSTTEGMRRYRKRQRCGERSRSGLLKLRFEWLFGEDQTRLPRIALAQIALPGTVHAEGTFYSRKRR